MKKAKEWDLMLSYVDEDGARQYDVIEPDIDKIIKQFARNQNKKGWLELSDSEKKERVWLYIRSIKNWSAYFTFYLGTH